MKSKFILILVALLIVCPQVFAKSIYYADNPSSVAVASGTTLNTGTQLITGQCNLQSIILGGPNVVAGDYVLLYDNTSATGTPKLDVAVGVNASTISIPLHETEFGTGVFANASSSGMHISVEYTQ